jgi:Big-like domain-containing protein
VPSECTGGGSNTAPVVTINSPSNNDSFAQGSSVTFTGTANDTQQGSLTAGLVWKDGATQIGTGGSFSVSNLAVGSHTITASVTDSGGLTGSASVTISITPAPAISLTSAKRKVKGVNTVDLSWTGASGAVDVYRNDVVIAPARAGSSYTDNTGSKGGQTFTYKVCDAGSTTTCSNTVTVVF